MAATFPFVDPFRRVDNALWNVFHCRRLAPLAVGLRAVWELWGLHPKVQRRVVTSRTRLLKVVLCRILRAANLRNPPHCLALDQLSLFLVLLRALITASVELQRYARQLGAATIVRDVQCRFSEFTSGWKLCIELQQSLSTSFCFALEFMGEYFDLESFEARQAQFDVLRNSVDVAETSSSLSIRTTRSAASSLHSTSRPNTGFELKTAHYQTAIAEDATCESEAASPTDKFKLKTLEEHRFATRFQEKRVTLKTWRPALREAHQLIRSGDRVNVAEALYLLLEIIWLAPKGINLATLYLDTGSIYLVFDHLEEAAKAYRNCLRLDPTKWKARYNLGVTVARLQDFVEATRQLNLALGECSTEIAEEIHAMLEEINAIQCSKNLRAFQETDKARSFTTQYLESVHLVVGSSTALGPPIATEDHSQNYRNNASLTSSAPQLLHPSSGWQGALASLLHRLHTFAWCRRLRMKDELLQIDPTRTGGVSTKALQDLVLKVTGTSLRRIEREELDRIFGERTILFHFLVPDSETLANIEEMHRLGPCYSLLDLSLTRKRGLKRASSKAGGLWYWMELTMKTWVEQILPHSSQVPSRDRGRPALMKTLRTLGCFTPMDFVGQQQRIPEPTDLPMLRFADRGVFIYECHKARACIQDEASRALQMFFRRCVIQSKRRKLVRLLGPQRFGVARPISATSHFEEDLSARLAEDTAGDQLIVRAVLQAVDDLVDDVVNQARLAQKVHEDEVRWQGIPVRTEHRQKTVHAAGVVQSALRSNVGQSAEDT